MHVALKLHPDSTCAAVTGIDVDVVRLHPAALLLRYVVPGSVADLLLPALTVPRRADGLWQHSCFEAFVRSPSGSGYWEFNVAPSTQWAAYSFTGRRVGMRVLDELEAPRTERQWVDDRFELRTSLDLRRLAELPHDAPWQVGLSAVIEEASGRKSYWALTHPPGQPDFHHPDCFALEAPAPERT